jgi:hypothetical protein
VQNKHIPSVLLACFALASASCHDDAERADDEIGDDGDDDPPIPRDPLDGGGGVPPDTDLPGTSSDPTRPWTTPATLGNGLVHDSRYDHGGKSHHREFLNLDLEEGVRWSGRQ